MNSKKEINPETKVTISRFNPDWLTPPSKELSEEEKKIYRWVIHGVPEEELYKFKELKEGGTEET